MKLQYTFALAAAGGYVIGLNSDTIITGLIGGAIWGVICTLLYELMGKRHE